MTEYGPEFEPIDFRNSRLYKDLRAIAAEHIDPNEPAFTVMPRSGDPDEVEAAAIAGAILNDPENVERMRREYMRRLLFG